jgi:hypothetical protein
MTKRANLASVWGRLTAARRGRLELTASGAVVVLLIGAAFGVGPAIAAAGQTPGNPVPAGELPYVVAAALSCPTLTPPRVAGQLMALSGFDTSDSGASVAGLSDVDWTKWKPSDAAQRDDPQANILALSHQTCELVGEIRGAGIDGDLWQLAVAAQHGGINAVLDAKGVPGAQKSFVDKVAGYASWYADQDQFAVEPAKTIPSSAPAVEAAAPAVAVPSDLVGAINDAGKICPLVTPDRIAAQLRAASDFNVNLRTDQGVGIAQFSTAMWDEYAGPKSSVWDANDAIATLGSAMCDLSNQFSGLTGADPYTLALGAFQWGPDTIRMADGLPQTTVTQLATTAQQYVAGYQKDARLNGGQEETKPSAPASASASTPASASASATAPAASPTTSSPSPSAASTPAADRTTKAAPKLYDPSVRYQIQDGWAGAVLELPGDNVASLPSGTRVQLWSNLKAPDQYWRIAAAPAVGYVIITNDFLHKSLAVENAATTNQSKLVVETTNAGDPNQQWSLADAGNGQLWITNHHSGKVMDLLGDDLAAPVNGGWNGYLVEQWDKQSYAKDQRWVLIRS